MAISAYIRYNLLLKPISFTQQIMHLNIWHRRIWKVLYLLISINFILFVLVKCPTKGKKRYRIHTRATTGARKVCIKVEQTLQAQHKSCFLRPDTGPCRADIVQWYYDVKQSRCFRFFWGGCQGNGNRFETREECTKHCFLNTRDMKNKIPFFCSLTFDYGHCFGHFYRFTWDNFTKTCRRRLYSGCGGNQNNFQTRIECLKTCLTPPINTLQNSHDVTTCIPLILPELQ